MPKRKEFEESSPELSAESFNLRLFLHIDLSTIHHNIIGCISIKVATHPCKGQKLCRTQKKKKITFEVRHRFRKKHGIDLRNRRSEYELQTFQVSCFHGRRVEVDVHEAQETCRKADP